MVPQVRYYHPTPGASSSARIGRCNAIEVSLGLRKTVGIHSALRGNQSTVGMDAEEPVHIAS
jgi:hypothetical protein